MKAVRSTKQAISNVLAIVGGALFGAGLLVATMHLFFDNRAAVIALLSSGGALAFSGMVELIISAAFRKLARIDQENLARLKSEGVMFAGEITSIKRLHGMYFARSYPVYVECSYVNNDGKTCLVRSRSFLHSGEIWGGTPHRDNYSVWVYVNPHNPHDYAVEVCVLAV